MPDSLTKRLRYRCDNRWCPKKCPTVSAPLVLEWIGMADPY